MWNPNAYRDTDYGLTEDEPFEPDDIEEDFLPGDGEPHIQTVLGAIRPEEAEVALVHEYVQWRPAGLGDPQAALVDLEAFFTSSGRTLVSAATPDAGRDLGVLLTLAQHVPVHIVAATGWSGVSERRLDVDGLASQVESDVEQGMDGTPVRPGMLMGAVGGMLEDAVSADALRVLAAAQRRSGLPATVMAERPGDVERALSAGFAPKSLMIGGVAARDSGIAALVADAGAWVLIAPLSGENGEDDRRAARLVASLAERNLADRLLVSSGFRERRRLNGYGGQPGLAYIVEQFAVMLLESGMEAPGVRSILVDNAARALSVRSARESA
jgi:predicted metal-dependent phosphotriesterase family hydrolase